MMSELMDQVGQVRIRTGEVEAQKPQIIKPDGYEEIEFEGFNEEAREFFNYLKNKGHNLAFLKYGFVFKRTEVKESVVNENFDHLKEKLLSEARREGNPAKALIQGVDDAWEYSLLKFTIEMIQKSSDINAFDFHRKGLL